MNFITYTNDVESPFTLTHSATNAPLNSTGRHRGSPQGQRPFPPAPPSSSGGPGGSLPGHSLPLPTPIPTSNRRACPTPSIRLGTLNIGGLRSSEAFLVNTIAPLYDAVVLCETKVNDRDYLLNLTRLHGWTIIQCTRPCLTTTDGMPPIASGGVAVIVFSPRSIAIRHLHDDPHGLLSVELAPRTHSKGASWAPINIVASYIPPSTSPYFEDAQKTLSTAMHLVKRAIPVYGLQNILMAGDFNFRLGSTNSDGSPRFTADLEHSGRSNSHLLPLLSELNFTPLHGRDASSPATITSRPIALNGQTPAPGVGAEVDYIFAHSVLGPTFTTIPRPPWSLNLHADTHICIGVAITLVSLWVARTA